MAIDQTLVLWPITANDLTAIAALHAASFDEAWSVDAVARIFATAGTFGTAVGWDRGLFGYAIGRVAADQAELLSLAVDVGHRRRGLARRLVVKTLAEARGCGAKEIFLEVGDDNHAAADLYKAAGFTEVGRRAAYYRRRGLPAIGARVLRRDLANTDL